jgi:hypothetical protein
VPQQIADVRADPEIVQLPRVDADTHGLIISLRAASFQLSVVERTWRSIPRIRR